MITDLDKDLHRHPESHGKWLWTIPINYEIYDSTSKTTLLMNKTEMWYSQRLGCKDAAYIYSSSIHNIPNLKLYNSSVGQHKNAWTKGSVHIRLFGLVWSTWRKLGSSESWEPQINAFIRLSCKHACGSSYRPMDWHGRKQPIVSSATNGQAVLASVKMQAAEQCSSVASASVLASSTFIDIWFSSLIFQDL